MVSESLDPQTDLRPATESDASFLTELALRSKGHWDYDPEFLRDCRDELTVTPEFVSSNVVFVVEEKGIIVGFYDLERQSGDVVELVHLYVEPHAIGHGYGKGLMRHASATARRMGFQEMMIKSDPNAEPFYLAMGATRVGEIESPVRPGRMLPLLRFDLSEQSD